MYRAIASTLCNATASTFFVLKRQFSIQSLFKTTPWHLKRQRENHTGVLASDSSHEYTAVK